MKIATRDVEGVTILKLTGRLTLEEIHSIEAQTKELLANGRSLLVINMIDVRDLSSSGIAKILAIKRTLESRGGMLVLSDLSPVCEHVLDLAGLTEAFVTCKNDAAAIALLQDQTKIEPVRAPDEFLP
ncbi:MAG: STAS domain-containing protein [Spirochaetia bacterium]|nr:STAS domain-containing protein [Spirochaetia bacterium]